MKAYLLLLAVLVLWAMCGCARTPQPANAILQNTVATVPQRPLPPLPPAVNLEPAQTVVKAAMDVTDSARADVRTALAATPPPQVAQPLASADTKLTTALGHHETALGDLKVRQSEAEQREQAREKREATQQRTILDQQEASKRDAVENQKRLDQVKADSAKQIADLEKANKELQDEIDGRARLWLTMIGVGLLVLSAFSFAARLYFGFTAGFVIAALGGTVGAICLGLARYLHQIEIAAIVGLSVLALAVLSWGIWHAFQHVPAPKPAAEGDK